MKAILDVETKIKHVEEEKDQIENELDHILDLLEKYVKNNDPISVEMIQIIRNYTKNISDKYIELNYLNRYKGETTNK